MGASRYILGVDPGADGALALYNCLEDIVVSIEDMPMLEVKINKSVKRRLDMHLLHKIVKDTADLFQPTVIVEEVHFMPKQGGSSAFAFGECFGAIKQVVVSNNLRMHLVSPAVWKKSMKLSSNKDESRLLASRLFPKEVHRWQRKKDDGRAESLLLALYGANHL